MSIRFKAVVAALGFVVAAGSLGTAFADTVVRTTTRHGGIITKSVRTIHRADHRVYVGTRTVKHVRILDRGPALVRPVLVRPAVVTVLTARPHRVVFHPYELRTYGVRTVTTKKIVRITHGPLQRHAMFRRVGGPAVVIR